MKPDELSRIVAARSRQRRQGRGDDRLGTGKEMQVPRLSEEEKERRAANRRQKQALQAESDALRDEER